MPWFSKIFLEIPEDLPIVAVQLEKARVMLLEYEKENADEFSPKLRSKNYPVVVHVLQTTQILVISRCCFAEDGKEMYQEL